MSGRIRDARQRKLQYAHFDEAINLNSIVGAYILYTRLKWNKAEYDEFSIIV